jgi:hypothetical protein
MDEYVTKPLRRGDLLASIAKVLMNKIPGTNIPMLSGAVAGLPPISTLTGSPAGGRGTGGLSVSASQLSRGLSPSPSASIREIPDIVTRPSTSVNTRGPPSPEETTQKTP